MRVIKLGGSLTGSPLLREWLNCISESLGKKTIIVPGGGAFAEQVRSAQQQWQFDDRVAHSMALLAMQQMALLFQGINPQLHIAANRDSISQVLQDHDVVIWSPDIKWLASCSVTASWDVTSDSLAAWLARQLQAELLIVVKSAELPKPPTCRKMSDSQIVDRAFCQFISHATFAIQFYHRNDITLFKEHAH